MHFQATKHLRYKQPIIRNSCKCNITDLGDNFVELLCCFYVDFVSSVTSSWSIFLVRILSMMPQKNPKVSLYDEKKIQLELKLHGRTLNGNLSNWIIILTRLWGPGGCRVIKIRTANIPLRFSSPMVDRVPLSMPVVAFRIHKLP